MTSTEIRNTDDVIDSRDVIERISDLEDEMPDLDESEYQELQTLRKLQEDAENYSPDWHYGETLIRDSYFRQYAQELAEDCGMINDCGSWPNYCIDWDRAARELKVDYAEVDFGGVSYWIRG